MTNVKPLLRRAGFTANSSGKQSPLPWLPDDLNNPATYGDDTLVGQGRAERARIVNIAQGLDAINAEIVRAKVTGRPPRVPDIATRQGLVKQRGENLVRSMAAVDALRAQVAEMKSKLVPQVPAGLDATRQVALLARFRELPDHEKARVMKDDVETRTSIRLWPAHMSGMNNFRHADFLAAELQREHPELSRSIADTEATLSVLDECVANVAAAAAAERAAVAPKAAEPPSVSETATWV